MMKKQLTIIVLACMLFVGCAGYRITNPDGTVTEIPPEQVINDAIQTVAPGFGPWGYAIAAIAAAVTGVITTRRVGKSKEASYNAGIKVGSDITDNSIGEPGDGDELDRRGPIGVARGPE